MCLLIAEILMLVGGLYALIVGRVRLTKNQYLEGWRARVAGLFLMAPLPLALVAGLLIGLLIGIGALPASAESAAAIVELVLVLGGLVGAVLFAAITKPKASAAPGPSQMPSAQATGGELIVEDEESLD